MLAVIQDGWKVVQVVLRLGVSRDERPQLDRPLQPRRSRREEFRRWERDRPMQLWQMDVMGGVRLDDTTELKVITGVDDHSRFSIPRGSSASHLEARREVLAASLRRGAPPQQPSTTRRCNPSQDRGARPSELDRPSR